MAKTFLVYISTAAALLMALTHTIRFFTNESTTMGKKIFMLG